LSRREEGSPAAAARRGSSATVAWGWPAGRRLGLPCPRRGVSQRDGPQGCRDPRHGHLLPAHLRAAGEASLPPALFPRPCLLCVTAPPCCTVLLMRCGARRGSDPLLPRPLASRAGVVRLMVVKDCFSTKSTGELSWMGGNCCRLPQPPIVSLRCCRWISQKGYQISSNNLVD
jgi:hypothetical protein